MLQPLSQDLQEPQEYDIEYAAADIRDSFILLETMIEDALRCPDRRGLYVEFRLTEEQIAGLKYAASGLGHHVRELYYQVNGDDDPGESGDVGALDTVEVQS